MVIGTVVMDIGVMDMVVLVHVPSSRVCPPKVSLHPFFLPLTLLHQAVAVAVAVIVIVIVIAIVIVIVIAHVTWYCCCCCRCEHLGMCRRGGEGERVRVRVRRNTQESRRIQPK